MSQTQWSGGCFCDTASFSTNVNPIGDPLVFPHWCLLLWRQNERAARGRSKCFCRKTSCRVVITHKICELDWCNRRLPHCHTTVLFSQISDSIGPSIVGNWGKVWLKVSKRWSRSFMRCSCIWGLRQQQPQGWHFDMRQQEIQSQLHPQSRITVITNKSNYLTFHEINNLFAGTFQGRK